MLLEGMLLEECEGEWELRCFALMSLEMSWELRRYATSVKALWGTVPLTETAALPVELV